MSIFSQYFSITFGRQDVTHMVMSSLSHDHDEILFGKVSGQSGNAVMSNA